MSDVINCFVLGFILAILSIASCDSAFRTDNRISTLEHKIRMLELERSNHATSHSQP